MQMSNKCIFWLLIIFLSVTSCHKNDRYGIKSAQKRDVEIHRFDKAVIGIDTAKIEAEVRDLYKNDPDFMSIYISQIIGENTSDTAKVKSLLLNFLKDTSFVAVNKKVLDVFGDVSSIEKKVSVAFAGINHIFPQIELPEIYFFVSGFNSAFIQTDKIIGIGTDLYLGSDYPEYSEITYKYLTQNMRPESVPIDIVSALLYKSFPMNTKDERLLDHLIYHGKILYMLSVLLPEEKPEYIIGYSKENLEWCSKFEKEIWSAMIEQKHLFSTDMILINKYINDAPFTATISQESPGRLATWIGWQIVESYMNTNKEIGLSQLMDESNAQKILENSGYQP